MHAARSFRAREPPDHSDKRATGSPRRNEWLPSRNPLALSLGTGGSPASEYPDDQADVTPEAEEELARAEQVLQSLSFEMDTKTVLEHVVEARETYGSAYLEIIRDVDGNVVQIDFIEDTPSVTMSRQDDYYTPVTTYYRGEERKWRKKFRHYRQQVLGRTVYYREFGDPRVMDSRTGEYITDGSGLPIEYQANEILEFPIGPHPYGDIRWRGNIMGIDGARRAEILNETYFINGRHTPMLIFLRGGMLDPDSESKLEQYMSDIKGEAGQHAFIVLCEEPSGDLTNLHNSPVPEVEIKDLTTMLQKDELFTDYIDNKRKQVQSSFLLPDLYVGYTTAFNRATAQTAKLTTEEQVFKNERLSLAWIINHKLLNGFRFRYVEAYFMEPNMTDAEDLYKLMQVCNAAGGITPNKAQEILYERLGEQAQPFPGEWGDVPIAANAGTAQGAEAPRALNFSPDYLQSLNAQLDEQIARADLSDPQLVPVMKSVRRKLVALMDKVDGDA